MGSPTLYLCLIALIPVGLSQVRAALTTSFLPGGVTSRLMQQQARTSISLVVADEHRLSAV